MQLADIKPGMEIVYRCRKNKRAYHNRTGIVRQVTPRMIAVQGERYPDTILVNDLLSGQVNIIKLKGEVTVNITTKELPTKEGLVILWEKHKGKINPIAKEIGKSWNDTRKLLTEAGIIDSLGKLIQKQKQTPPPNLEELGGENQDEGEKESASAIIPENETTETAYDIPPVNMPIGCELPREDGFTTADDEPIPYVLPLSKDTTEAEQEEMAKCDTVEKTNGLYLLSEAGECDLCEMTPEDKNLLETVLNAYFAVKRVQSDPVALALMKRVLESGVV